jgi:ribonuclease E
MSKKMLIDAAHHEELRVVVNNNNQIEEFDYQTTKRSIKGNIYLAKVTRVEPSLQAAFVDYGNLRQGFLPFSEIHPDYYQIPVSDRESLLDELRSARKKARELNSREVEEKQVKAENSEVENTESIEEESAEGNENEKPQNLSDEEEEIKLDFHKRYKIQEVIKKDQIILVQVEKEERGNKGASLTTYISLAGRYCVLMPNATKVGGVSRKISDEQDRRRLRKISEEVSDELDGNGAIIIRTAGAFKTKTEIKRDTQYLQRLWDIIREHTLKSKAPAFIHEEGDVIKKALRDLYDNEIEEILVEGSSAFDEAKSFMKMILPKHTSKLKLYDAKTPLFIKYNIESQLAQLHVNEVKLKSGGYIVINPTEALVAIDVNSGRSTSERSVEDTALRTNIEAAREIARQLKLRDLSGLVVVDFIDMEDSRNRKAVEKAFRDALANDRARVQIGRISSFGLLEMSRQRLRQNILEANTEICNHCNGKGRIRAVESSAVVVLRAVEAEIAQFANINQVVVSGSSALVFYLLNQKREQISKLEEKFGGKLTFYIDETAGGDGFFIETQKVKSPRANDKSAPTSIDHASYNHENFEGNPSEEKTEEEVIPTDEVAGSKIRFKKPRKFQNNRGRNRKERPIDNGTEFIEGNFATDPQPTVENEVGDSLGNSEQKENQHQRRENDRNGFRKKFKHGRRFNKGPRPNGVEQGNQAVEQTPIPVHHDEPEIDQADIAKRRKKNESLLKEIWKKIVD